MRAGVIAIAMSWEEIGGEDGEPSVRSITLAMSSTVRTVDGPL